MRKILGFLRDLIAVLVVLAVAFGAGYYYCYVSATKEATEVVADSDDSFDFELPLEVEKRVVTVEEAEAKLVEIGELSTYAGEYTCTLGKEESRYWLDKLPVLGSTNSITITLSICRGGICMTYDFGY